MEMQQSDPGHSSAAVFPWNGLRKYKLSANGLSRTVGQTDYWCQYCCFIETMCLSCMDWSPVLFGQQSRGGKRYLLTRLAEFYGY